MAQANVIGTDPAHPSPEALSRALEALAAGGVAIFPTDSVYGIGCLASAGNPALERIFELKGREPSQTLPLLVGDAPDLDRWGQSVRPWARALARALWPGALTLVVEASPELPPAYRAADGTVGLRLPACELVRGLVRRAGLPLAATSANLHGEPAARGVEDLGPLAEAVDLVVDGGPAPLGVASTVVDATGAAPRILRAGALSADVIAKASGL